ncbi:ROK family protein [Candidatus Cetobacterium colombiensis]|uniref:ROK family protein n=1 Tax=Candidatus Cetobacterium colombiensis TaxID=3073100 RepID=A0ABU4WBS2_9FUSO|nr:ROK family protein [Candidatus Cetobacterium colombiensis]MDX8336129.1 ROK family protein [Candidatus Cetobacterium colombiensis]
MVTGMNMENLKNNNKIAILSYLNRNGESSRKKIAEGLKLTTATLTILTNELIEEGIVKELGALTEGKVGRKQILIDINQNSKFSIGIEISRNNIYYNLINLKAEVIESNTWKYIEPLSEDYLIEILKYIQEKTFSLKNLILGIGITVYGGLDENDEWKIGITNIKKIIEKNLNFPTFIQNNIRALALAEQYLNKKEKNFWLVKYGPGVGAAIIMNGKLVEGYKRMAGDIGHIVFEENKEVCKMCGQIGCLESEINFNKTIKDFDSKVKKQNPILNNEKDFEYILRLSKFDNNAKLEKNLEKLAKAIAIGAGILDSNKIILAGDILKEKEIFNILEKYIIKNSPILHKEDIIFMDDYVEKRKKSSGILVLKHFYNY